MDAPKAQPERSGAGGPLRLPDAAGNEKGSVRRRRRLLVLGALVALIGGCGLYFTPGRGPGLAACVPEGCELVLHASRPLAALRVLRESAAGAALLDLDTSRETRAQLERLDRGLGGRLAAAFAEREVLAAFGKLPDEGAPPDLLALRIGLTGNVLWKAGALLAGKNVALPSGGAAERFDDDDGPLLVARAGDVLLASPDADVLDAALARARRAPRERTPRAWSFETTLRAGVAFETAPGRAPDGSLFLNAPVKVSRVRLDAHADASGLSATCDLAGELPASPGSSGGSLRLLPSNAALAWTWRAPDTDARRAQDLRVLTQLASDLGWVDVVDPLKLPENLGIHGAMSRLLKPLSGERCLALLPQKLPAGAPRVAAIALLIETRDAKASAAALPALLAALWPEGNEKGVRLERTTHRGVDLWRPVGVEPLGEGEPLGPGVRPCLFAAKGFVVLASSDAAARAMINAAPLADSAEYKAAARELPAGRFAECVLLPGRREPDLVALYKYAAALGEDARSLSEPLGAFLDTTDYEAAGRVLEAFLGSLDRAAVGWERLPAASAAPGGVRVTVKVRVRE